MSKAHLSFRALSHAALFVSTLLFAVLTPSHGAASSFPTWFPKQSCEQAWGNRDRAAYDWKVDSRVDAQIGNLGYSSYRQRLAEQGVVARRDCFKEWTILVYIAADNDLSPYALWDLEEMEGRFESGRFAGSTLKTDLLTQVDTEGPSGVRRLHVFQREDRPYVAARSKAEFEGRSITEVQSPIVEFFKEDSNLPEHDQRLRDFLAWGVREYPAKQYMVILWGHGQGWSADPKESLPASRWGLESTTSLPPDLPQAETSSRFGGLLFDPASGTSLAINRLAKVLDDVVQNTLEGRRFDIYASDACLMQMAEVAYEVAPFTRYIVGSAQVQSYLGLPYRRLLYELNTGRLLSASRRPTGRFDEADALARMLPILAEQSLDPLRGHQGQADQKAIETFTMSTIASDQLLWNFAPEVQRLGQRLREYLAEDSFRAMDLPQVARLAPSFMGGGKEFGAFLTLLEQSIELEVDRSGQFTASTRRLVDQLLRTRAALDETVLERRFGRGYRSADKDFHLLGYRALGVWLPQGPAEFRRRSPDFRLSKFNQATGWLDWLDDIY